MPCQEDDAGSWCLADWDDADYDFVSPSPVGDERWETTVLAGDAADEKFPSPWFEVVMLNGRKEVVTVSEVSEVAMGCNNEFRKEMVALVQEVQQHHASLLGQFQNPEEEEDFVKVDGATEDLKILSVDNGVDERRKEMQLLLEDFLTCSYNEHFNWHERISRPAVTSISNDEAIAAATDRTPKDDIKDILKKFSDKNITSMKNLVKEIKESNEKLVEMLVRNCERTNRCLNELENEIDGIILPKEDCKLNAGWEEGLLIDLVESSYSLNNELEEGHVMDFAQRCDVENDGWEDARLALDDLVTDCDEWERDCVNVTIPNEHSDMLPHCSDEPPQGPIYTEWLDSANISLQCNYCSSQAMCLTCIQRRKTQLVLPGHQGTDKWTMLTGAEHSWHPGPWPPLRLSLAEKVKELDRREKDALLIGKWIRTNKTIMPALHDTRSIVCEYEDRITLIEDEATEEGWEKMSEKLSELLDEEDNDFLIPASGQTLIPVESQKGREKVDSSEIDLDELITWVDEAAIVEQWRRMNETTSDDVREKSEVPTTHNIKNIIVTTHETSMESQWKKMDEIVRNMLDENAVVELSFDNTIAQPDKFARKDRCNEMNKKLNSMADENYVIPLQRDAADEVIDPDVKKLVDWVIEEVSSIGLDAGWTNAAEMYESVVWEESEDTGSSEKGAGRIINDLGYMWEFLT